MKKAGESCIGSGAFADEILVLDSGSTDATWETLSAQHAADPRVHGIRFARNYGKAAALAVGFRAARGNIVITMDADLQDSPSEIPRFLEKLEEGYDVVSGWKQVRHDPTRTAPRCAQGRTHRSRARLAAVPLPLDGLLRRRPVPS